MAKLENSDSERISALETGYRNLDETVKSGFDSINRTISNMSNQMQAGSKTNWSVVLSAVGAVTTIFYLALQPIKENLHETKALSRLQNEKIELRIKEVDKYLQREMRDLVSSVDKRVSLRVTLLMKAAQASSAGLDKVQKVQIGELQRVIFGNNYKPVINGH